MNKNEYLSSDWAKIAFGILIGAFVVCVLMYLRTNQLIAGYSSNAAPMTDYPYYNYERPIRTFPNMSRYDVDLSGQANFEDARFITAFVAGTGKSCPKTRCDISGDGRVTSYDAALLTRALNTTYDIDWNGRLDSQDPAFIANAVANPGTDPCPIQRCDVDGSETVTSHDAAVLSQIIATFPGNITKQAN